MGLEIRIRSTSRRASRRDRIGRNPLDEGGKVNCKKSCIVIGRLCRTHHNVTMNWVDVKRLAQVVATRLEQARQSASNADISEAKGEPACEGGRVGTAPPLY